MTHTSIEFQVEKATILDRIVGYFRMRRFMRIRKPVRRV